MEETHNILRISERFLSIQGESASAGAPSVFLRLQGCPCNCVFCDTTEVWKKGTAHTLEEVDHLFDINGYYSAFKRAGHLVITGGDPMLQQKALVSMFKKMEEYGRNPQRFYVEVETQATIVPLPAFSYWVRQWNISPKLSNSGMPKEKRLNIDLLREYGINGNSWFKFPVSKFSDLDEVQEIVEAARLKISRVYLMPICSTRAEHLRIAPEIVKMCLRSGYRFSPRLQLLIWDQATGV